VIVMRSQFYPQVTAPAISNILIVTSQPAASQEVTIDPCAGYSLDRHAPGNRHHWPRYLRTSTWKINIAAVERTYMARERGWKNSVRCEAVPGTAYPYEAKNQVEVLVGSASGLSITY